MHNQPASLTVIAICLLSASCYGSCPLSPVKEVCADGYMMSGDDCIPVGSGDMGPGDMGPRDMDPGDAAVDEGVDEGTPDAGPCGMPCEGAMAVCDAVSGMCVQCTDADATACAGTATPACDTATGMCAQCTTADPAACTGATPVCDTTSNMCVGCVGDTDCTAAGASECAAATQTCVGCTADASCTRLGATPVCDEVGATCVACTADTEAARCGANSCNPATHTCTATPRTSVRTCGTCVADSECLADNRCVPMMFAGAARTGGYCLKRGATGCVRPYTVPTDARASLSGAAAEAYCGVDETATTCEAVLALVDDTACAAATDADCGASGLADGLCRTVSLVMNRCTYACGAATQCPAGFTCTAGYCGS